MCELCNFIETKVRIFDRYVFKKHDLKQIWFVTSVI